jgi:hypothetical protein
MVTQNKEKDKGTYWPFHGKKLCGSHFVCYGQSWPRSGRSAVTVKRSMTDHIQNVRLRLSLSELANVPVQDRNERNSNTSVTIAAFLFLSVDRCWTVTRSDLCACAQHRSTTFLLILFTWAAMYGLSLPRSWKRKQEKCAHCAETRMTAERQPKAVTMKWSMRVSQCASCPIIDRSVERNVSTCAPLLINKGQDSHTRWKTA